MSPCDLRDRRLLFGCGRLVHGCLGSSPCSCAELGPCSGEASLGFARVRAPPPGTRVVPGSCLRCDHSAGLCMLCLGSFPKFSCGTWPLREGRLLFFSFVHRVRASPPGIRAVPGSCLRCDQQICQGTAPPVLVWYWALVLSVA
jgi:hypothetical protein